MTATPSDFDASRAAFEALVERIRPELHRYVTRMVGSVIDGEDVVQQALVKAYDSLPVSTADVDLRPWLFRIAHNKAIDQLRRDSRQPVEPLDLLDETLAAAPVDAPLEDKELAADALSLFLQLTPRQRSCVILKDVMGYSLAEISEFLDATVPEIKALLHRGRTRLRAFGSQPVIAAPVLDPDEQQRLARYVDRFNARDFDAVRAMLADDVQLDLINRLQLAGREAVGEYFHRYDQQPDWQLAVGAVEGRPAVLFYEAGSPLPAYLMLISWKGAQVSHIRDYRYVRYVMQDARLTLG